MQVVGVPLGSHVRSLVLNGGIGRCIHMRGLSRGPKMTTIEVDKNTSQVQTFLIPYQTLSMT
jgi:hypothetical protein